MSLKTDYYDGATGLQQKMNDAFDAGVQFVVDNTATLSALLIAQAAQGQTTFNTSITASLNGTWLRANNGANLLTKAYFAGIQKGLADSDIYSYECSITLDVTDSIVTKVKFNFTFATT